ncbi:MAG: peroxidase family protein [Verrucomicrobiales bacterium]
MKPTLPVLIAIAAIQSSGAVEFRTIDGSGNNLANPDYGQAGTELLRISNANYGDGIGAVDGSRVNPRLVSNAVFDQPGSIPDARGLSEWVWVWGQFIDHDMDHTLTGGGNGTLQIEVPTNDPYFGDLSPNNFINVTRSDFTGGLATARAQISNITPWLDAGNVYGGRASDIAMGNERQDWLRTMDGTGRLKTTDGGAVGDLLPKWDAGAPGMANTNVPTMGANAYVAGDVRANEHVALLTTHTVLSASTTGSPGSSPPNNPGMGGDEIYDRARKIVGAEIQAITYNEFLPAIGVVLPTTYGGYDNTLNPAVAGLNFSTAASLPHGAMRSAARCSASTKTAAPSQGNLNLADSFFQPGKLAAEGGLEPVILEHGSPSQEETDAKIADEALRNQLFQTFPTPPPG